MKDISLNWSEQEKESKEGYKSIDSNNEASEKQINYICFLAGKIGRFDVIRYVQSKFSLEKDEASELIRCLLIEKRFGRK